MYNQTKLYSKIVLVINNKIIQDINNIVYSTLPIKTDQVQKY